MSEQPGIDTGLSHGKSRPSEVIARAFIPLYIDVNVMSSIVTLQIPFRGKKKCATALRGGTCGVVGIRIFRRRRARRLISPRDLLSPSIALRHAIFSSFPLGRRITRIKDIPRDREGTTDMNLARCFVAPRNNSVSKARSQLKRNY